MKRGQPKKKDAASRKPITEADIRKVLVEVYGQEIADRFTITPAEKKDES